jgi:hypothetical protein
MLGRRARTSVFVLRSVLTATLAAITWSGCSTSGTGASSEAPGGRNRFASIAVPSNEVTTCRLTPGPSWPEAGARGTSGPATTTTASRRAARNVRDMVCRMIPSGNRREGVA